MDPLSVQSDLKVHTFGKEQPFHAQKAIGHCAQPDAVKKRLILCPQCLLTDRGIKADPAAHDKISLFSVQRCLFRIAVIQPPQVDLPLLLSRKDTVQDFRRLLRQGKRPRQIIGGSRRDISQPDTRKCPGCCDPLQHFVDRTVSAQRHDRNLSGHLFQQMLCQKRSVPFSGGQIKTILCAAELQFCTHPSPHLHSPAGLCCRIDDNIIHKRNPLMKKLTVEYLLCVSYGFHRILCIFIRTDHIRIFRCHHGAAHHYPAVRPLFPQLLDGLFHRRHSRSHQGT